MIDNVQEDPKLVVDKIVSLVTIRRPKLTNGVGWQSFIGRYAHLLVVLMLLKVCKNNVLGGRYGSLQYGFACVLKKLSMNLLAMVLIQTSLMSYNNVKDKRKLSKQEQLERRCDL